MDKSSSKKQKKTSKRSHSSASSSEDDNYKRKRRLKETEQENLRSEFRGKFTTSSQGEADRGEKTVKKSKKGGKLKERKKESSIEESSTGSTSEEELHRKRRKKQRKKERKKLKKEKRRKDKKNEKERKRKEDGNGLERDVESKDLISGPMPQIQKPVEETIKKRRPMVPMTKEEYEKQQSKVRRVFDPDTGRNRLVKGDGEIIEEAVSYQRHKEINKLATLGDGASFEKSLGLNK